MDGRILPGQQLSDLLLRHDHVLWDQLPRRGPSLPGPQAPAPPPQRGAGGPRMFPRRTTNPRRWARDTSLCPDPTLLLTPPPRTPGALRTEPAPCPGPCRLGGPGVCIPGNLPGSGCPQPGTHTVRTPPGSPTSCSVMLMSSSCCRNCSRMYLGAMSTSDWKRHPPSGKAGPTSRSHFLLEGCRQAESCKLHRVYPPRRRHAPRTNRENPPYSWVSARKEPTSLPGLHISWAWALCFKC